MRSLTRNGLIASLILSGLHAQALTVYDNDFDAPVLVAPGVTAALSAGGGALISTIGSYAATWGSIFRNDTSGITTLTLSNLPAHTAIDIDFVAAYLDSWDSTNGSPAPDYLNVSIDNVLVGQYSAANASGNVNQFGAGQVLALNVQFDANQFYSDSVVDHGVDPVYSFAHTGSSIVIAFQASGAGWQGGGDESWGLGSLTVTVTPVPEPTPLAMLLAGLAVTGWMVRRRR